MSGRSRNLVDPRSSTGYVGLRNLGCICYMNSTIQQFFMNPDFRRGVLSWNETAATAAERAESMMYQMQKQFAYLQESEKQYYNPRGLCNSIKDWEGNPTDVSEQKDVPEFLTKLFADMETQCQGTPLANLPKDVFGGQTQQELIAEDPRGGARKKLYATRDDDYYFLQVGVKGKKNLQQALGDLVSGEMVDYKWTLPADAAPPAEAAPGGGGVAAEGAAAAAAASSTAAAPKKPEETTVRTMKRMSIKSVGDHLMLHLNRFEFDYETMQQAKLNDRFEFPRDLDMWPYTVWGRADAFAERDAAGGAPDRSLFQYELVGVVIHMGTAVGGHYYSYIRERDESGPGERWFEFNDSFVSPWAGSDDAFVRDCFGGVETVTTGGYSHTTYVNGVPRVYTSPAYVHERVKSANAFVVYYDRVKPRPAAAVLAREMSVTTADAPEGKGGEVETPVASLVATTALARHPRDAFVARLKEKYGGGAGGVRKTVRAAVPGDLLRVIQDENTEFWRLSVIYQVDYFTHMLGLMGAVAAMAADAPPVEYPWQGLRNLGDAMAAGGPLMVAVRLAVAFMLNTLTDSNQKASIPQWQGHLATLLSRNTVAAAWIVSWLTTDTAEFRRMFLADSSAAGDSMRPLLAAILTSALATLWPIEAAGPPAVAPPARPPLSEGAPGGRPLAGVPGALARNFVEGLLDQLPRLHVHWRRFGSFFTLLRSFADISVDTRRFLLERGVVARLIDFALGGDSPHPELNDTGLQAALKLGTEPTRDASGRYLPTETRIMGDNYGGPDLSELMATVTSLLRSCQTPSGSSTATGAQPPQLPLLAVDVDCVTCRQFWEALTQQMTRYSQARTLQPLVTHLLWGVGPVPPTDDDEPAPRPDFGLAHVLSTVLDVVVAGIKKSEWDGARPYFRLAGLVMNVAGDSADGSLQAARVDAAARAVLGALRSQARFFRATELGIEEFVKLAKTRRHLRSWMSANGDVWAWCEKWYAEHPRPPATALAARDDGGIRLLKRPVYGYYQVTLAPMRDACTLQNIRDLLAADEPEWDLFESDEEPEAAIGRRLTVTPKLGRPLPATFKAWDAKRGEFQVQLDDGSTRWVNLRDYNSWSHQLMHSAAWMTRQAATNGAAGAAAPAAEGGGAAPPAAQQGGAAARQPADAGRRGAAAPDSDSEDDRGAVEDFGADVEDGHDDADLELEAMAALVAEGRDPVADNGAYLPLGAELGGGDSEDGAAGPSLGRNPSDDSTMDTT